MDKARRAFFYSDTGKHTPTVRAILYLLFFCSGCSAVIYQVMWQRMLYILFGVDLESITIIVSVFMFGLGIGGLFGGYIADRVSNGLLQLYVIIEAAIAIFGFSSPKLIHALGNILIFDNKLLTAIVSFIILAVPTILMGATFPILVTHVNASYDNVGRSVGNLYFINTLGGVGGAILSGYVLLFHLDVPESIYCSAALNLFVAGTAFVIFRR